jgi:hypothetical protein
VISVLGRGLLPTTFASALLAIIGCINAELFLDDFALVDEAVLDVVFALLFVAVLAVLFDVLLFVVLDFVAIFPSSDFPNI